MDTNDQPGKSEAVPGKIDLPPVDFGGPSKSTTRWALLALCFVIIMLLVLASPFVLVLVNRIVKVNWTVLSNIGQAYGLVSAVVSAIALSGVAFSLILQRKQTDISQLQALRAMQFELVQMGYENPKLGKVWNAKKQSSYMAEHRYINLWFMYYQAGYKIGAFSESIMSLLASSAFESERIRRWWLDDRETYAAHADTASGRRFVQLVDTAYREAALASKEEPKLVDSSVKHQRRRPKESGPDSVTK